MRKRILGVAGMLFCSLCLAFGTKTARAASVSVNQIAYVSPATKSLVLKFEGFSEKDYTYTLTNVDQGVTVQKGTLNKDATSLRVALGEQYQEDTRYKLVLTGSGNKTLGKYYYTGEAVQQLKSTKAASEALHHTWKVTVPGKYTGYKIGLYPAGTVKPSALTKVTPGSAVSKDMPASTLKNGRYRVYLMSYKTIKGANYAGQGLTTIVNYVKKPRKVSGLTATPYANRAKLTWNTVPDAAYYTVYMASSSSGKYTAVKRNVKKAACTVTGLKGGKKYYFKVTATAKAGTTTVQGTKSSAKSAKIPVVAGKVQNVRFGLDSEYNLAITWDKTQKASGYRIYYKKSTELAYKALATTQKTICTLDKLDPNTKYNLKVCAYTKVGSQKYLSSETSKILTITPKKYKEKHFDKMLAETVRSIGYIGTSRCIYTTKKYPKAVKLAFVNYKGYSSKTKYLIWISHYTQQVTIFEGKKGNWKQIRSFICATGTAKNHSPRGTFKLSYKERGWFYTNTKELYVSHYCGRNSFHTRPLWNDGSVQNPTIGKPASHGCIRCYNQDAKYIYDKMPCGTTVVSY